MIIQRNRKALGWYRLYEGDFYCKFFLDKNCTAIIYELNADKDFLDKMQDVFINCSVKQLLAIYAVGAKNMATIEELLALGFKWNKSSSESSKLIHTYTYDINLPDILEESKVLSELCNRADILNSNPEGYRLMNYNDYLVIKDQYDYKFKEDSIIFTRKNDGTNKIRIDNLGYKYSPYAGEICSGTLVCNIIPINESDKVVGFGMSENSVSYVMSNSLTSAIYIKNHIELSYEEHNQDLLSKSIEDQKFDC